MDGITDSMGVSLSKLWVIVNDREACHAAVHESQSNSWTTKRQTVLLVMWRNQRGENFLVTFARQKHPRDSFNTLKIRYLVSRKVQYMRAYSRAPVHLPIYDLTTGPSDLREAGKYWSVWVQIHEVIISSSERHQWKTHAAL